MFDASHLESCSSVVQSMSIRMTLAIAEACDLKVIEGCFGNAFPHSLSLEKVHAMSG